MNVYEHARKRFIQLDEASQVRVGNRRVGDGAFLITAGSDSVEDDEIAPTMLSIAEQKAIVSANMVEALVERGRVELNSNAPTLGYARSCQSTEFREPPPYRLHVSIARRSSPPRMATHHGLRRNCFHGRQALFARPI